MNAYTVFWNWGWVSFTRCPILSVAKLGRRVMGLPESLPGLGDGCITTRNLLRHWELHNTGLWIHQELCLFKYWVPNYGIKDQRILSESCLVMSDSLRPHGLYSSWNSPGHSMEVGSLSLLQRIFPTQGLNPGLLHCRQILYQLSHKGSPRKLELVAYPFSRGFSWPRNWTQVSCIAGRFFTNWAMGEAQRILRPPLKIVSSLGARVQIALEK